MKRGCAERQLRAWILTVLALSVSGCGPTEDVLRSLSVRHTPFPVVGEDGNTLLFAVSKKPDGTIDDTESFLPRRDAQTDVYALNLVTMESELVMGNIRHGGFSSQDIVANGRWIAWVDRDEAVVQVVNREDGSRRRLFEGLEEPGGFGLLEVRDDRLIAFKTLRSASILAFDEYEYIILDLLDGNSMRIGDSWLYATYAISGDHFALMNNQPTNVEAIELELTGNIDVVDLATGARQTIAPNIRVGGGGGDLFIRGDELVWQEFRQGKLRTKIRSYDFVSGKLSTLRNPFEERDTKAWVFDISGTDALVSVTSGSPGLLEQKSFEIGGLDTDRIVMAQFFQGVLVPPAFHPELRFVGDFAVWVDVNTADFVIYNPEPRGTQRFDPRSPVVVE